MDHMGSQSLEEIQLTEIEPPSSGKLCENCVLTSPFSLLSQTHKIRKLVGIKGMTHLSNCKSHLPFLLMSYCVFVLSLKSQKGKYEKAARLD